MRFILLYSNTLYRIGQISDNFKLIHFYCSSQNCKSPMVDTYRLEIKHIYIFFFEILNLISFKQHNVDILFFQSIIYEKYRKTTFKNSFLNINF